MKNVVKFSLTLLSSVVLTACGGGGGSGSDSSPQPVNTNSSTVTPTNSTNTTSNSTVSTTSTSTGGGYIIAENEIVYKSLNNDSNLNTIVVDGKEIRVAYEDAGIYSGSWFIQNDQLVSCCGKYESIRFGAVDLDEDRGFIFYNGTPSKSIPTSGVVNYTGDFILVDGEDSNISSLSTNEDYHLGSATFQADFSNKNLTGALNATGVEPINVNATIQGNSFSGTAKSASFKTTAELEGKFFGQNAKELAGAFDDKKPTGWGGAFGATKQ